MVWGPVEGVGTEGSHLRTAKSWWGPMEGVWCRGPTPSHSEELRDLVVRDHQVVVGDEDGLEGRKVAQLPPHRGQQVGELCRAEPPMSK
jgi:hypothetical protein